jgi:putative aminopeptidase FrvX
MIDSARAFLSRLLETPSPSGFEAAGQRVWADYVRPVSDEFESDSYGNALATLNPAGSPKILLTGHADELGFMIGYINDEGFIYFKGIGGVDPSLIRGQRVVIHGRGGPVHGVTGQLAIHLQAADDRKKVPEIHDMVIDIGARTRKEAESVVAVGDAITYAASTHPLLGDRIAARGCDNRIGTWAAAEALRRIAAQRSKLRACVVAASTIQEENGLYGATMAAYRVRPDVALVIDVTHATDTPQASRSKHGDIRLGGGPVLSIGSANHPVVNDRLRTVAKKAGIPLQFEINPRRTGTDADAIFLQRGGIPTASIGLPNRYMHSPVEVIQLSDLDALAELLAAFVLDIKGADLFRVKI